MSEAVQLAAARLVSKRKTVELKSDSAPLFEKQHLCSQATEMWWKLAVCKLAAPQLQ